MRQILFQIPLDLFIPLGGMKIPVFGAGALLVVWLALSAWWGIRYYRERGLDAELQSQFMFQAIVALIIWKLPVVTPVINIYGYGMAMVCGFLIAAWLAAVRARREGIDPTEMWDIGMVVLFSGVIGARLFYIFKNPGNFFGGGRNLFQTLFELVNLTNGGLVLYGGVLLGIAAYLWYCHKRNLSALKVADIVIPSIFIGEMFGRIGCFLNGCCYGDILPPAAWWAVYFPPGSVPFMIEVKQGLIPATAQCSLPLQPAQLLSSFNALVLAIITWIYYPYRARNGSVLLLGWVLYPITRFGLEIIRGDTPGEFGTWLTIAQWVSIGMLIAAAGFGYYLSFRPKLKDEPPTPPAPPTTARPVLTSLNGPAVAKH